LDCSLFARCDFSCHGKVLKLARASTPAWPAPRPRAGLGDQDGHSQRGAEAVLPRKQPLEGGPPQHRIGTYPSVEELAAPSKTWVGRMNTFMHLASQSPFSWRSPWDHPWGCWRCPWFALACDAALRLASGLWRRLP